MNGLSLFTHTQSVRAGLMVYYQGHAATLKNLRGLVTPIGKTETLSYVHILKKGKVTDKVDLEWQIAETQIAPINKVLETGGMPALKQLIASYSAAIEAAGRKFVASLGSAGVDAKGRALAWLHSADMILMANPKAVHSTPGLLRNNSIIGGNNKRIAREIPNMPDDVTKFDFSITYT